MRLPIRWVTPVITWSVLVGQIACTEHHHGYRTESPQIIKMDELPSDFKIPANIWDLIETTGEVKSTPEANNAGVTYSSVRLFLTEKNPRILNNPSYVIELPRGGGFVDMAQYLSGQQGSFYVGFELPSEFQEGQNLKVIYISTARKRKLDHRVFGAGCNQYFEITPKFIKTMSSEGIKVNTTRQRHVTVLAGHYIFSVMKDNRIYITRVTITDSLNKNLLCEAL